MILFCVCQSYQFIQHQQSSNSDTKCQFSQYKNSAIQSSHYDQLMQAISLLKAQIEQDNKQSAHTFELISLKLKLAEQQTQQSHSSVRKYQKQINSKVNNFASQTKQMLKQIIEAYPKNEGIEAMERELKELQICRDKMVKNNASFNTQAADILQTEIFEFERRLKENIDQSKRETKQLEKQLKKQIEMTRKKIQNSQQRINEVRQLQKIQNLYQEVSQGIASLRNKRKERKEHFLNLLQAIILKCKEKHQNDQ